jgi:hypothetical protein
MELLSDLKGAIMNNILKNIGKALVPNMLPEDLFHANIHPDTARELFIKYVRQVEIENHNYCNRRCWFCPNSLIDRHSTTILMDDQIFNKIIDELKSINYAQSLLWTRYHEPLAHSLFFKRVKIARSQLPKASLVAYSNGDFLNRETLTLLEDAGLDCLHISLYPTRGKERDQTAFTKALEGLSSRVGLSVTQTSNEYVLTQSSIYITARNHSFSPDTCADYVSTRGGIIKVPGTINYQRYATCYLPLHSVNIDYNGKCVLCCHTLSDAKEHAGAVVGSLCDEGYSLFDFYRELAPFRSALLSPEPRTGICRRCNVGDSLRFSFTRCSPWSKLPRFVPGLSSLLDIIQDCYMKKRSNDFG